MVVNTIPNDADNDNRSQGQDGRIETPVDFRLAPGLPTSRSTQADAVHDRRSPYPDHIYDQMFEYSPARDQYGHHYQGNQDDQTDLGNHYNHGNETTGRPQPSMEPAVQQKTKPQLTTFFGIFPGYSTVNLLKIFAIITLILLVEINLIINLESGKFVGEHLIYNAKALIGVGIIGIFLGLFYRYIEFEFETIKWSRLNNYRVETTSYIKLVFFLTIIIALVVWIIIELVFTLQRGLLVFVDLISILTMTIGVYVITSAKRSLNIILLVLMFTIMLLGIDYSPDLPKMFLLAVLVIAYLELSDGACRLHEQIVRFRGFVEDRPPAAKAAPPPEPGAGREQRGPNLLPPRPVPRPRSGPVPAPGAREASPSVPETRRESQEMVSAPAQPDLGTSRSVPARA